MIKDAKPNTLILGDSIVAGLRRYPKVWNGYLAPMSVLNLGIGGDRVENVLLPLLIPGKLGPSKIDCGDNI